MASQSLVLLDGAESSRTRPKSGGRAGAEEVGETEHPAAQVTHARVLGKTRSIALVEDQQELLSTYEAIFDGLGWKTVFAGAKGEELVAAAEKGAVPEVVIMDYRLPGIDGIDAALRLKRVIPGVKVVVTTADDRVRAEAEGAGLLFLQKPFSAAALVELLSVI